MRSRRPWRRIACLAARTGAGLCAVGLLLSIHATIVPLPPAVAATAGTAIVVGGRVSGDGTPITSGDKTTAFSLDLPDGAACSGDTAKDNYKVQSYMVPTTLALQDLQFSTDGILNKSSGTYATFRQPLFDEFTTNYQNASTAEETGAVINIPNFSFAVWAPEPAGAVPAGTYNIGIACNLGVSPFTLDKYWNARISVTENLSFTVLDPPTATSVALSAGPKDEAAEGKDVTLTATVTPAAAAGAVTFRDGGASLGSPVTVSSGTATFTVNTLKKGSHTLVAAFAPTADTYAASSSTPLTYKITDSSATTTTTTSTTSTSSTSTTSTTEPDGTGTSTTTTPGQVGSSGQTFGGQASVAPSTGGTFSSFSTLANTGGSLSVGVWGALMVLFGRMAVLLARPPRLRPALGS